MATSRLLLALAVYTVCGACAYAPRVLTLERVTHTQPPAAHPSACVVVRPFADVRAFPRKVGVARNGLGSPAGEVRTYADVPGWIAQHIADELGAAPACAPGQGEPYVVDGTVIRAFVDEYAHLDGVIVVDLRVTRGGYLVLERRYEGHHRQLSWAGSEGEFTDVIHKSLLALSRRAVPELAHAVGSDRARGPAL